MFLLLIRRTICDNYEENIITENTNVTVKNDVMVTVESDENCLVQLMDSELFGKKLLFITNQS